MIAYTGYTIGRIKRELSWREVRELLTCWEDRLPICRQIERIEQAICKAHGLIWEKPPEDTPDRIMMGLEEMGISIG